jgi:hypothetical protein
MVAVGAALVLVIIVGLFGIFRGSGGNDPAADGRGAGTTESRSDSAGQGTDPAEEGRGEDPEQSAEPDLDSPAGMVDKPWAAAGSDFGVVTEVQLRGEGMVITFNRQQFLFGGSDNEAFDTWVAENGQPDNDYVILDENPRLRTFPVAPDASFSLVDTSGEDGISARTATAEEFAAAVEDARAGGQEGLQVWLFHDSDDLSAPVTEIQQQFLP